MQSLKPPPPPPPPPIISQWNDVFFDFQNSDSDPDNDNWWDLPAPPPPPFLLLSGKRDPLAPPSPAILLLSGKDFSENKGNTSESSLASCPICRDDLHAPDTTVQHLPCTHVYHQHCIMLWLQDKNTCPVCRFQIPSNDLDLFLFPSLAETALSLQQHLPTQSFSSTILPEILPSPPPRPPLPPPPFRSLTLLRPPELLISHQSASTSSLLIAPPTEAETIIQPSAPVLSTTTEESLRSDSTASLTVNVDEIHSISRRRSNRRFRKTPTLCWLWCKIRCIGHY